MREALERGEEAEVVWSSIFEGWGAKPVLHTGEDYPKGMMTDLLFLLSGELGLVKMVAVADEGQFEEVDVFGHPPSMVVCSRTE